MQNHKIDLLYRSVKRYMVLIATGNVIGDGLFHKKKMTPPVNDAFKSLCFRYHPMKVIEPIEEPRKPKIYGGIMSVEESDGETRYALVQGHYTGKWSFPKGHSNDGELPLACALREIGEEVGIDSLPAPVEYHKVGYGNYYVFVLHERQELIPRDTHEIMNTAWVTLEEMRNLTLNADVSQFVKMKERDSNSIK